MKATVFCILCLVIGAVVSINADHQMQQDLHRIDHHTYTM
jgi:hypothetical protein